MTQVDLKKGMNRVWKTWKWGILTSIIVGIIVFLVALNVEFSKKSGGVDGEEPLTFYETGIDSPLASGGRAYTVTVTNDQEYVMQNVKVTFQGAGIQKIADLDDEYSGSLDAGDEASHPFNVQNGAVSLDITLNGEGTLPLFDDLNMYLDGLNGTLQESKDPGSDESISIGTMELETEGYGTYTLRVKNEGTPRIGSPSYTLRIRVTYPQPVLFQAHNSEMGKGESVTFDFAFNIEEGQVEGVTCKVESTVKLSNGQQIDIWQEVNNEWFVLQKYTPAPDEVSGDGEPWGPVDLTGTFSMFVFGLVIITGFLYLFKVRNFEITKPKIIGPVHCFGSLLSLMFAIDHSIVALMANPSNPWSWASAGMIFSYLAIVQLAFLALFSFLDAEFIEAWGRKKWRYVHLFMTISLILWVIIHIGYMGDHFGFLK